MTQKLGTVRQTLRAPRAAGIAGIAFALMLGTALVLVRLAVPTDSQQSGSWLDDRWRKNAVVVALYLVLFAGLAFLWFVGAIRDRIGLDPRHQQASPPASRVVDAEGRGSGQSVIGSSFASSCRTGGCAGKNTRAPSSTRG